MERYIWFAMIFGSYGYLAWQISVRLGYTFDAISLVAAFSVAALTSFTWVLVTGWWGTITKPFAPQTVKLETKETPFQIGFSAFWAFVKLSVGIIVVAVLIYLAVRFHWI